MTSGRHPDQTAVAASGRDPGRPAGLCWRPVLLVAAAMLALELLVSARYGMHRDELYFLACARHLSWGYVDQPPLVPAVARVMTAAFGVSAVSLRVVPALAGAATVVLAAATSRELGGRKVAQVAGSLGAATSAEALAAFHLLSTAAFDIFFWTLITFLVARLLRTGSPRLYPAIGVTTGAALLNKLNVVFLIAGLILGLVASGRGRLLLSRWMAASAVLALAIFAPDVIWNVRHDWAQLSMLHALHNENSTLGASLVFVPAQLVVVGPVLAPLWLAGLSRLLRHRDGRPLAISYLALLVVYAVSGAKPYYLAGAYSALFAAGGINLEERIERVITSGAAFRRRIGALLAGTAALLPLALPVLPRATLPKGAWESSINKDLSATVGWRSFTAQVAAIAGTLPGGTAGHPVILTGDYGAAGAIDLYGNRFGLGPAYSGHNNYWWWGPPRAVGTATVAVNLPRSLLVRIFSRVVTAGSVATPRGIWTEERGDPIWICTGQKLSWASAWPLLRHYG